MDGFIARPDGGIDWLPQPEEGGEAVGFEALMDSVDFVVMGRATFEQVLSFGDVWPYTKPVVVLSTSLREAPERLKGKVSFAAGEPRALLKELGATGARRVYIDGGNVIQEFLKADLVDEIVLTTIPVLIGKGVPLFGELPSDLTWEVKASQHYPKLGCAMTTYSRKS